MLETKGRYVRAGGCKGFLRGAGEQGIQNIQLPLQFLVGISIKPSFYSLRKSTQFQG